MKHMQIAPDNEAHLRRWAIVKHDQGIYVIQAMGFTSNDQARQYMQSNGLHDCGIITYLEKMIFAIVVWNYDANDHEFLADGFASRKAAKEYMKAQGWTGCAVISRIPELQSRSES